MNVTPAAARPGSGTTLEDRIWLAAYPPQVPATIDEGRIGTLADIFRASVAEFGDRPAVESFGTRMTYRELGQAAAAVASWLQAQGLKKGDRVAIMLPNVMAYPAILFGVLTAGGTVVNVNPLYTARELAHQLDDAKARVLFVLENFGHTVEEASPHLQVERVVVVTPGDLMGLKGTVVNLVSRHVKKAVPRFSLPQSAPFRTFSREGSRTPPKPVVVTLDDTAFLQYTGGTTGVAKGAVLLHRNVAANVAQCDAWMRPFFGTRTDHVMVTALPLYHIFALTVCALLMTRMGACQLLIANPRDLKTFVKTLRTRPFTLMSGVNTLYNALASQPGIEQVNFSDVVLCVSGGMATQAAVARRWRELTGKPIIEGYGLSETSPVVCANRARSGGVLGHDRLSAALHRGVDPLGRGRAGAVGRARRIVRARPQVMAGYWGRPEESARALTPDGFFRTGDVAVMLADGQVKIVDRMKDMVLVSGFNVYPNEVEEVLAQHPGVLEAAVIGLPDERSGECVAAYVVRRDETLTEEELRAFCRDNLTGYKVPRRIEFRSSLPKTNVGKVLRRALRDQVISNR